MKIARRKFLTQAGITPAVPTVLGAADASAIVVDSRPLFDISPLLYMQFMEPLGASDSSVEASGDYDRDDWREDFVAIARESPSTIGGSGPGSIRFGGLFSRYYPWREGVGPVAKRPRMRNYVWGGKETNRVGTHEFADF
jgi:alpha-L-arabinofuranosidase